MFRITEDASSGSLVQCLAKNCKNGSIVSVDKDVVGVTAAYSDILHRSEKLAPPSSFLQYFVGGFKYFIILIVSTYYILCINWIIKCLIKYHIIPEILIPSYLSHNRHSTKETGPER